MADENREPISFGNLDLGISATSTIDSDLLSNFLSDDPNDVSLNDGKTPEKKEVPKKEAPKKSSLVKGQEEKPLEEEKLPSPDDLANSFLKDEEEEIPETEEAPPANKEDGNAFTPMAKQLLDLGIFTLDDGETQEDLVFTSGEEFRDRWILEKQKGAGEVLENFLTRFGQGHKEMFDSVFINGVDPVEYASRFAKIQEVEGMDLTDEGNLERLIREKLRRDGLTAEQITSKVDRIKGYNDLEVEGKEAHSIILAKEKLEQQEATQKKAIALQQEATKRQQTQQAIKQILTEKITAKEFDGIPVDAKFAQETANYLLHEKYKLPDGKLLTEFDKEILDLQRPENQALKVKVAMLVRMIKTDPTLSKIQKKAINKETNRLFGELERGNLKNSQPLKKTPEPQKTSWFNN